ncbi:MAG: hypothetical protein ABSF21_00625 [Dehalococcoidia bacterium]
MISVGDCILKLGLDKTDFDESMKQIQTAFGNLGKTMLIAGTAIVGGLVGSTVAAAQLGTEIEQMSIRTGISTVALSELRYMAQLSGTSFEGLEMGIKRMQVTLVEASNGSKTATDTLKRMGLSITDLMALSPGDQFYAIAGAIASIPDPTVRAATAVEVFGRSGTDLLPIMKDGAKGMEDMKNQAHEYGEIIDTEAATKSVGFTTALTNLKESLGNVKDAIGKDLMPMLTDLLNNKIIPLVKACGDWIQKHKDLLEALLKIGGVLMVGGIILVGLSNLAQAIIAIDAALIILQGIAGPAGWVKLAVGIGIAVAAIVGLSKLMNSVTGNFEAPTVNVSMPAIPEIPSAQFGGIVPGPIGQPVPIIAHGGEPFLGVQNIGRPMGNNITINLGVLPGDDATARKVVRAIRGAFGEDKRRNSFAQLNKGYYYGSSGR